MKKLFSFLSLVLMGLPLMASPVEPEKAALVAKNFVAQYVKGADQYTAEVVYTHLMPKSKQPAMYVVNVGNTFVLVSANDVAHPVLGYSLSRPWPVQSEECRMKNEESADAGVKLPSQITSYLDDLAGQIASAAGNDPDRETAAEWQQLLSLDSQLLTTTNLPDSVGPLLTTTWDQGQYYNALCPADANGPDGHVYTGCVATAMAQIINYWGYPVHGRGSHSYNVSGLDPNSMPTGTNVTGYGTRVVHFDSATYDYANMPDALTATSTPQEVQAVAQLMYHCGVAVNMLYNYSESGAQEEDVRAALISYYGFAPTLGYAHKQMYTNTEWIDSLRANINRGEPVFYCGRSIIAAHAFVLDGYKQDDFFHFNFGWSGDCDGWFLTTAINVGFGFNEWQSAIMGIRPNDEEHAAICHRKMYVQNNDYFTVTEPIDLYPMRGGSGYRATNEDNGVRINLNLVPADELGQLVLDVIEFDNQQSVVIYDGINKDSLVRVIETRNLDDYSTVFFRNWLYDGLPTDSIFQNMASVDLSPVVSTRHGLTVVVYSYGGIPESFHLRVSDASDCRMVSNLTAIQDNDGVLVSWTENGDATQWQVKVEETIHICDSTHILLTGLSPDSSYNVQVRAVCGLDNYSSWNTIIVNKKVYWTDIVKSEPEGYSLDGDTIRITSPEGLAWLAHSLDSLYLLGADWQFYQYSHRFISIENDLDLGGLLWKPIGMWFGNVNGNGYVINNMEVSTSREGGLFTDIRNSEITDIRMTNSKVNSVRSAGSIAGVINNCSVNNCSSENYITNAQNGIGGGLFGTVEECQINNCYAYGKNYSQFGYGGLVGDLNNSNIQNCVTQLGENFNWGSVFDPADWRGLITEEVHGGSVSNCFSEISNSKWYGTNPETYRSYFLGNVDHVDVIENLATFNISLDEMGMLITDTAVNYNLGENMNVVTALNSRVAEYNSSNYRTWIRDSVTHLPVFGDFYEVTCPNVSNITASNIPYNNGFAVDLSWQENGDAEEWQIKYMIKYAPDNNATIFNTDTTNVIIEGLELSNMYEFYIRPLCGDEPTVGWGQPFDFYVDKTLWIDVVTSCPEGYVEDNDGNIMISSAEGLAWFTKNQHICQGKTISIVDDIDMGAYRWTPVGLWDDQFTGAVIEGNNHVISNLYCHEYISDPSSRRIGFFGYIRDASIYNLTINNSSVYGHDRVGSLFGEAIECTIDNCHVINAEVKGYSSIGGLGGAVDSYSNGPCYMSNCSASGIVIADQFAGGLLGVHTVLGTIKNCYANCDVISLGMLSQSYRGGLIGAAAGAISNCYSVGDVAFSIENSDHFGSLFGNYYPEISVPINSLYAKKHNDLPLIGGELDSNVPISDTASIVNGVLETPVIIDETSHTNLLDALNAWVDANDTAGIYRHWAADSANVNGGYPVFAAIPCTTVTGSDSIVVCDRYTWRGTTYTSSTELMDTLSTLDGCDSIVTHHLTVNHPAHTSTAQVACVTFNWNNSDYTISGDYTYSHIDSNNCTQVDTLHLTINNPVHAAIIQAACETYTWNETVYTASGDYTYSHLDANNCTQVDTLRLTINNPVHTATTQVACESYTWAAGNGITYTIGGNYTYTHADDNGCTQVDTLHLTINNPVHTATTQTACETYTWNNTPYTNSGTYTYPHLDANNCTQVDTLHLTIHRNSSGIETVTACNSYVWQGITYTSSTDTPTFTSTNAVGCDSVTTLNLTINQSSASVETVTACDSLVWHGNTYKASTNVPTYITANAVGCDSTVTLHLTINRSSSGVETVRACETYTWHGNSYTASTNEATYTTANAVGCDSVTTLHLTINHASSGIENVTACDSYTWHGTTYTESTNLPTYVTTNRFGCDSTVTLHLVMGSTFTSTDNVIACDGYTWHGTTYTVGGTYERTASSTVPGGCDSTFTLNLTLGQSNSGTDIQTACNSYIWHGTTYTTSNNTAIFTETNASGCDSVVTLNLTVNYSSSYTDVQTACDSYLWNGFSYTASTNTPFVTLTNAVGCDSVTTLHLTVNYSNTGVETVTACNSYTWHGNTYTTSTSIPTHTETNAAGCDSVVTLHLTINQCSTFEMVACESYTWHNTTYNVSGVYVDGTDTLMLTINTPVHSATTEEACASYTWQGVDYTTSGDYTYSHLDNNGCTQVDTLHLTINTPVNTAIIETACDNYIWQGTTYTTTGNYTYSHLDANGCTQVDTLHLTINTPVHTAITETACETFTWNGTAYTATGDYTYSHQDANGCTQVDTLHLNINFNSTGDTTAVACDNYTWYGTTYTTSTTPTHVFSNAAGCDSTVTLNLTINHSTTSSETVTACESYLWSGQWLVVSGQYFDTSTNAVGCDSIVTLNLTINNPVHTAITETACDSYTWQGADYTVSGDYTYSHTDANGCTQVDTLHLTINNPVNTATTETACDSYTWQGADYTVSGDYTYSHPDANGCTQVDTLHLTINYSNTGDTTAVACDNYTWYGTTYTTSTTPTHVFSNAAGCDSTVTLNLTINQSTTGSETVTACESYLWSGQWLVVSGQYFDTNTNAVGCDSIVTLNLTINNPVHTAITETACNSYTWNGITYTATGDYTYSHTDANGCTQVDTLHLTINNPVNTATTETACDSYTWQGTEYTASGDYTYSHLDANGCTQVDTLHLTVNYSAEITVTETAEESYTWNGTTYTESGTYQWLGTTAEGCDSTVTLNLTVTHTEGIDDVNNGTVISISVLDGRIIVGEVEGQRPEVRVYDVTGRQYPTFTSQVSPFTLPDGVYLVKVGAYSARKVVVIR